MHCNWTSCGSITLCWNQSRKYYIMVSLWCLGIVQCLPKQNQDVVFYFIHCSIVWRLKLALEVKEKRKVSIGSRSWDWMLDLFRVSESGCRQRQCGRSENRHQSSSLYKRGGESQEIDLKERAKMKWKQGGEAEKKEAVLCLDWGGTGTQLRTDTIIVIQPALEPCQCGDAQLEALGEMKGRGVGRSTKLQCCLEHEKGEERQNKASQCKQWNKQIWGSEHRWQAK